MSYYYYYTKRKDCRLWFLLLAMFILSHDGSIFWPTAPLSLDSIDRTFCWCICVIQTKKRLTRKRRLVDSACGPAAIDLMIPRFSYGQKTWLLFSYFIRSQVERGPGSKSTWIGMNISWIAMEVLLEFRNIEKTRLVFFLFERLA